MTDALTTSQLDGAEEPDAYAAPEEQPREKPAGLMRLAELAKSPNIAEEMDEAELSTIAATVIHDYQMDHASRQEWVEENEQGIDFARQVAKAKAYPWPNAANVIYPLIAEAAIQFNARAYPAIVQGKNIAKAKVLGQDPDGKKAAQASRVGRHMSYQLSEEMEEWEEDTDRLLLMLPIVGTVFRKVWFDRDLGRNRSELITPDKLCINNSAKALVRAPRITQEIDLYPYEIQERQQTGLYRDIEVGDPPGEDKDATHLILEQHRRLDLDKDGYAEPYIVTVHKETAKVLSIQAGYRAEGIRMKGGSIAMVRPTTYYVAYNFMPDPKGGFYGQGFGKLLFSTNSAINTVINQLLDAGHMSTLGGGFIANGARITGGGPLQFKPNEWKRIDVTGPSLKDNIVPLPVKEPSPVLFELLQFLVTMGKDLAATKDILTGENVSSQMPATLGLAMIEQGLKVFTAIFKRVHRALGQELKILFNLNRLYLNPQTYFTFEDSPEAIAKEDYDDKSMNIVPVTDPSAVTDMQRLGRAQFLLQFIADPAVNGMEIRKRLFEAASIEDIDKLLAPPQPDPMVRVNALHKAGQIELMRVQTIKLWVDMGLTEATAINYLAQARKATMSMNVDQQMAEFDQIERTLQASMGANQQGHEQAMDVHRHQLDANQQQHDQLIDHNQQKIDAAQGAGDGTGADTAGGAAGMGGQPDGPQGVPLPPGLGGQPQGGMGPGAGVSPPGASPSDGGQPDPNAAV